MMLPVKPIEPVRARHQARCLSRTHNRGERRQTVEETGRDGLPLSECEDVRSLLAKSGRLLGLDRVEGVDCSRRNVNCHFSWC